MRGARLARRLLAALGARGWHISFAESCTGGLAAATLVSVSGSSAVLDGAFVTYANSAKETLVGVSAQALAAHGAVSQEVAGQMALGCAKAMGAEVGVGISGIAGPTGGTPEKPVGTVCFGCYVNGICHTVTHRFRGGRQAVRRKSVRYAYETLLCLIEAADQ